MEQDWKNPTWKNKLRRAIYTLIRIARSRHKRHWDESVFKQRFRRILNILGADADILMVFSPLVAHKYFEEEIWSIFGELETVSYFGNSPTDSTVLIKHFMRAAV